MILYYIMLYYLTLNYIISLLTAFPFLSSPYIFHTSRVTLSTPLLARRPILDEPRMELRACRPK